MKKPARRKRPQEEAAEEILQATRTEQPTRAVAFVPTQEPVDPRRGPALRQARRLLERLLAVQSRLVRVNATLEPIAESYQDEHHLISPSLNSLLGASQRVLDFLEPTLTDVERKLGL